VAYPLDPLSGDEFRAVASILRREHGVGDGWRFASIELSEPGKAELRAFDDGGPPPPRRAEVICLQRSSNATYKSVVSLTDDRIESFEHIPGVQANFTVDEFVECDQLLRTHPDVIAALGNAASPIWTWCSSTPGPMATRWHHRNTATAAGVVG
jgi:primary-amine oxidase